MGDKKISENFIDELRIEGIDYKGFGIIPKLLMLDEPSMGLAPILVDEIFNIVQKISKAGTTILLVEQNAQAALSIADRGYVLETGRITMSGKGTEVGSRFEELREILDRVELSDKMGVCLDTCHVSDAGYDIAGNLDGVLTEFDRVVGLDKLRAIHVNDSMNPVGAHKDRHAKIGQGFLGTEAFAHIINHPALRNLPFLLETPNELPGYAAEISLLKSLREE